MFLRLCLLWTHLKLWVLMELVPRFWKIVHWHFTNPSITFSCSASHSTTCLKIGELTSLSRFLNPVISHLSVTIDRFLSSARFLKFWKDWSIIKSSLLFLPQFLPRSLDSVQSIRQFNSYWFSSLPFRTTCPQTVKLMLFTSTLRKLSTVSHITNF